MHGYVFLQTIYYTGGNTSQTKWIFWKSCHDPTQYRSLAIALQYLTLTRSDITYAMKQMYLFMHDLKTQHMFFLKQIICYTQATLDFDIDGPKILMSSLMLLLLMMLRLLIRMILSFLLRVTLRFLLKMIRRFLV